MSKGGNSKSSLNGGAIARSFCKICDRITGLPIMKNKYTLYLVLALAIVHAYMLLVGRSYNNLVFFILMGVLASYFSKNMVLILGVPLIISYVFAQNRYIREGLENASASKPEDDKKKEEDDAKKKADEDAKKANGGDASGASSQPAKADHSELIKNQKELMEQMKAMQPMMDQATKAVESMGGFEGMSKIIGGLGSAMSSLSGGSK